jgi:hypothetical protein
MSVLGSDQPHVLFFRTSIDLGQALEQNVQELLLALNGEPKPVGLLDFLKKRSGTWLDNHVNDLALSDYDGHTKLVKDYILTDANQAPAARGEAFKRIANAVKQMTPDELERFLLELLRSGHAATSDALREFGGAGSTSRWQVCQVAALEIDCNDRFTRCSYRSSGDGTGVITVHIGDHKDAAVHPRKGSLRTHFCLLFQIFHEYVSHMFCRWQEPVFTEGYLLWVEQYVFGRTTDQFVRHAFVADTYNAGLVGELEDVHGIASWVHSLAVGDTFVRFLLDWASEPRHEAFKEELNSLRYFRMLRPKTPEVVELRNILEREEDNGRARSRLRALAGRVGGIPSNYALPV